MYFYVSLRYSQVLFPYLSCKMKKIPTRNVACKKQKFVIQLLNYWNVVLQLALNPTHFIIAKLVSCQTTDLYESLYHGCMAGFLTVQCLLIGSIQFHMFGHIRQAIKRTTKKTRFWSRWLISSSKATLLTFKIRSKAYQHCQMCQAAEISD